MPKSNQAKPENLNPTKSQEEKSQEAQTGPQNDAAQGSDKPAESQADAPQEDDKQRQASIDAAARAELELLRAQLAEREARLNAREEELDEVEAQLNAEASHLIDQQASLSQSLKDNPQAGIIGGLMRSDVKVPPEIARGAHPDATDDQKKEYGKFMRKNYPGRVPRKKYSVRARKSPKSEWRTITVEGYNETDAKRLAYKRLGFGFHTEAAQAEITPVS